MIPLEEVRADPEGWKETFKKEYEELTKGPVTPITTADVQRMEEQGMVIETLPAKAIASKKPPNRRKGRVVVCGNFTEDRDNMNVSVGGVCSMTVRGVVHAAACNRWQLASIDVKGAFLQAPKRQKKTTTVVQPPRLLQQLGLISAHERWLVNCALYGFVESPSDWAVCRDGKLEVVTWKLGKEMFWMEPTAERHLWKICKNQEVTRGSGQTAGWLAVYVDDFLVAMEQEHLPAAFAALKAQWTCSEEEYVTTDKGMRFCGYEITGREDGGFHLTQQGYVKDVINKYDIQATETHAVPKIEDEEDETDQDEQTTKAAQALCGELLWVAGRTRPDVAYGTGVMSRLIHRRPKFVIKVGMHLLRYLNGTSGLGLCYKPVEKEAQDWSELKVMADTSFAPPHEKYRSVQAVVIAHGDNVLAWGSSRQAFICQSTAEAELLGYNEALQMGDAAGALCQVLELPSKKRLLGDCKAALAQLLGDTGPWRTRHLRLRSAKLREALRGDDAEWSAEHQPGSQLVADGLTKALLGQAFQRFVGMLGLKTCSKSENPKVAVVKGSSGSSQLWFPACVVAGVAMLKYDLMVGALVLAAAVITREVAGRVMQDQKRPATKAIGTRPQSPKEENQNEERGQTYGFDRGGMVTPITTKAGAGIPQVNGDPLGQSSCRVGTPGIRAFRISGNGERSHGSQPSRRGSATARGQAAMSMLDRRRSSGDQGQEAEPDSESSNEEPYSDLRQHFAELGLQSEWENLQGDCEEPQPGRLEAARGSAEGTTAANAAPADAAEHQLIGNEPWRRPTYQDINRASKDCWDMSLQQEGWAVRMNKKYRVREFHPVHSSTPFDVSELEPQRVTVKLRPNRSIETDNWTRPRAGRNRGEAWIGYTFFKFKDQDSSFELVRP